MIHQFLLGTFFELTQTKFYDSLKMMSFYISSILFSSSLLPYFPGKFPTLNETISEPSLCLALRGRVLLEKCHGQTDSFWSNIPSMGSQYGVAIFIFSQTAISFIPLVFSFLPFFMIYWEDRDHYKGFPHFHTIYPNLCSSFAMGEVCFFYPSSLCVLVPLLFPLLNFPTVLLAQVILSVQKNAPFSHLAKQQQ